jgi:drug/metabolite transporter (DMT)-like permease
MSSAGLLLLPLAARHMRRLPKNKMGYAVLAGLLGSFFPAFLFCLAETKIDSALAGILNALTPISVITIGILFFSSRVTRMQFAGVLIGFVGLCLLFLNKGKIDLTYISYSSLVLLATISYGLNVNLVNKHLHDVPSLSIATFAFVSLLVPSLVILWMTGYFNLPLANRDVLLATGASALLGIMGTAVATILFYILLKKAGTVFSSMVTYGIPFFAIMWGVLAGESITLMQIACLGIILGGVYVARKK